MVTVLFGYLFIHNMGFMYCFDFGGSRGAIFLLIFKTLRQAFIRHKSKKKKKMT